MPKKTFFNLPKKKRDTITTVALDEFASYPFQQASVARIIKKSGIASGSFYQYFQDKLDLYRHLVDTFTNMKLERFAPLLSNSDNKNFFETFKDVYREGVKFARQNPKLQALAGHLYRDKELLAGQLNDIEPKALKFYGDMLKKGISRGDVRKDIDIELTSYFLFKLGSSVNEYIMIGGSLEKWDMKVVDRMIDFVQHGIGKKGG